MANSFKQARSRGQLAQPLTSSAAPSANDASADETKSAAKRPAKKAAASATTAKKGSPSKASEAGSKKRKPGRPLSGDDKLARISITLPADTLAEIDELATHEMRSRSQIVSFALREYLKNHPKG